MCGIVGILLSPSASDPRRLAAVRRMADTLWHRGPDGGDSWFDHEAGVALGHRRLAIVDLSDGGRQPMLSHGGRFAITFNGEIYNFAALRPELEALGHRFQSHSDTEVMLAAFESWGLEASLNRFAGMFAFGLWDRDQRVLHLARDRMGKKPLYASLIDGALVFASELKAIGAFPGFQPRLNPAAVDDLLRYGWIGDEHSIWTNVIKVPPGSCITVDASDLNDLGPVELRRSAKPWWSLADVAEAGQRNGFDGDDHELEDELDGLLRTVVRERMVADVPLGAFLSGGIDSSLVVALMQAQCARPVRTFTVGFGEQGFDEAGQAARIARHLGTEHTEMRLSSAEACAMVPDLPRIWDEPFADESQIPTCLVSRLARQHVTVALTGDGGDECFGGYTRHFMSAQLAKVRRLPRPARKLVASAIQAVPPDRWDGFFGAVPQWAGARGKVGGEHLHKLARVLDAVDDPDLYDRLIAQGGAASRRPGREGGDGGLRLADAASRFIFWDMSRYLPGDILVKLDRATMSTSLEGRCPFLDHRVVEFAWRIPTATKIRDGQGKWPLRQVLSRYLPRPLFEHPKHGFNVPIGTWLRGPLRDWAESLLLEKSFPDGLVDAGAVATTWHEHLSGRWDRSGELWAILILQAWLQERAQASAPPAGKVREPALVHG